MNKIVSLCLLILIISCKDEKEKEAKNIENILKTHLISQLKEVEKDSKLDSLKIIDIDSVSTKDELKIKLYWYQDSLNFLIKEANYKSEQLSLEIEQYRIIKYMNNLSTSNNNLIIFKNSIEDKKADADKSLNSARNFKNEVDQLRKEYYGNKIDSTNFIYYNVKYQICYTNSNLQQKCNDSLSMIITKDFKIKKL